MTSLSCEATNLLQAPKPRPQLKYGKSRSKIGFPEIRKVGQKVGKKGKNRFCAEKNLFLTLFDLLFDLLSGFPENLFLTNFFRISIMTGVWGLVAGSSLHMTSLSLQNNHFLASRDVIISSREKLYTPPPPLPPFLAKRHFPVDGGWGCIF